MAEPHLIVTFEVFTMRNSRWEIQARFGANDRNVAIQRAKKVTRNPNVEAVKVVKETYDNYADVSEESVIYKSRRVHGSDSHQPRTRTRVSRTEHFSSNTARQNTAVRRPRVPTDDVLPMSAVGKALFATFIAFLAAVLFTGLAAYFLEKTGPVSTATAESSSLVALFTVFCGIFLAVAFVSAVSISRSSHVATTIWARWLSRFSGKAKTEAGNADTPTDAEGAAPSRFLRKAKKGKTALPANATAQLNQIKAYLRKAVAPLMGAYDLRDPFIKFGINLFAAGVTEALCQERDIDPETALKVMAGAVRALGVGPEQADGFSGAYVEYLISDPRYMDMFASGRDAIFAEMAEKPNSGMLLHQAVGAWVQPSTPPEEKLTISVMFTSIAGYDDLLAERGDKTVREALRVHNAIASRALMEYGGKQIKQQQTGVMAAFMNSENALRAAFVIRDGLREHSKQNLELPLSANVGINCGEPIVEGNDLFGVTVQLAARIVGIAKGGEILVSPAIRDAVGSQNELIQFEPYGPFSMKGFSDPITLYKVAFTATPTKPVKPPQPSS
ncbi:MAG: adenylate/guanylate cyclase domain-containing protein [Rhodospirillales bacterium]|nr:adenylate/guanylate cyclase domain-containing protein [Rhodospirillales bacterium]